MENLFSWIIKIIIASIIAFGIYFIAKSKGKKDSSVKIYSEKEFWKWTIIGLLIFSLYWIGNLTKLSDILISDPIKYKIYLLGFLFIMLICMYKAVYQSNLRNKESL